MGEARGHGGYNMTPNLEAHLFQKRSVSLHGHKTSVSLEKAFWDILEEVALAQNISLSQLIKNVDDTRYGNLASALRLYGLKYINASSFGQKKGSNQPLNAGK